MLDQLASGALLRSPDLFTVIDNEIAPIAHDVVILEAAGCRSGYPAVHVDLTSHGQVIMEDALCRCCSVTSAQSDMSR
jgi:hypothetical protein